MFLKKETLLNKGFLNKTSWSLVCYILLFTACGENLKAKHSLFSKGSDFCDSYQIQKEYLVLWKDGKVTVEKSENDEFFVNTFVKSHEDQMISSEPHYQIEIEEPKVYTVNEDPLLNWGQKLVSGQSWEKKNLDEEETPELNLKKDKEKTERAEEIIIAILDSGMDPSHPQLQDTMAVNKHEEINGIDDDENGLIDDRYGFDFIKNSHEIKDYNGHGTHVAGIISARKELGPVQGLADHPQIKILPLSFIDKNKKGLVDLAIRGLRYAKQRGAKIINASWGSSFACSDILKNEINHLEKEGILFVTVAGNDGKNIDQSPSFPASFDLDNIIVVGASTQENTMGDFSNYGSTVDLLAPGIYIISTYPIEHDRDGNPDGWQALSGTSSAVPFVSATAALLWLEKPTAPYSEIKKALLEGVKPGPFPVKSKGHLHIPSAMEVFNSP